MQRIDENTYIDDTLVTCTEYQLFIDEMREQGKYYQPDHWTSYRFLRVRHGGLLLEYGNQMQLHFVNGYRCGMLVDGDIVFQNLEANNNKMLASDRGEIGFWGEIIEIDNPSLFFWPDDLVSDVRVLIKNESPFGAIELSFFLDRNRRDRDILSTDFFQCFMNVYENSIMRPVEFDNTIVGNLDLNKTVSHMLDRSARQSRFDDIRFARDMALEAAHKLGASICNQKKPHIYENQELQKLFALFIDIVTLQERIAGCSPVFEGIRLVKERIR